jgi:outer membrane protein TolC
MKAFAVVAALALSLPSAGSGQEPPAPVVPADLSLADALTIARQYSPAYRQSLNDRPPSALGVRNAWWSLLVPSLSANTGVTYTGRGEQTFLTSSFQQDVSTISSFYDLSLQWQLSGGTISQPGLMKAQQRATDAGIVGAERALVTTVTLQYLNVLQSISNTEVAKKQVERNEQFLRLARANYSVGRSTLLDVRQAQVARGQAEVVLLRAQTSVSVEKLRLFQFLGVAAPVDVERVRLSDTFAVTTPRFGLDTLLTIAAAENPSLNALRAQKDAATWGVRSAMSSYAPSLALSAGWAGFTQEFTDVDRVIDNQRFASGQQLQSCLDNNTIRQNAGLAPISCTSFVFGAQQEQDLRTRNSVFPLEFTAQPFQARLTVSLPLWTNWGRPLRVSEAKAQEGDLRESVRARGLEVHTNVNQAFLNLATAFRTIAIEDTNRTAAQEQLQLATERYRIGSGTFFDLLDAQVQALRAEFAHVIALYDYHRAVTELESAVGRSLR